MQLFACSILNSFTLDGGGSAAELMQAALVAGAARAVVRCMADHPHCEQLQYVCTATLPGELVAREGRRHGPH
jgi:hypothetical protein